MPYILFIAFFLGLWLVIEHVLPPAGRLAGELLRAGIRALIRIPSLERIRLRAQGHVAPFRQYFPVILVAAAGLVVSFAAGNIFIEIAEALHENSPALQHADETVHEWAEYIRYATATPLLVGLTIVGTPVGLGLLVAIVAGYHVARRRPWLAVFLVATTGIGGVLNLVLKDYFARARPDLTIALRAASGYSFPSGHAMGATIVFGALAYLAHRSRWSWRARSATMAACITLALGIALSRIYLGVHWISDIAGGIAAGAVWTAAAIIAYETFRRLRALGAQARGPNRPGSGSLPESDVRDGAGTP